MGNNVKDISNIINHGYRKKYTYLEKNISNEDIIKYDGNVILYIPKQDNLNYWIIEKYFFPKIPNIEIMPNLIAEDNNITYLLQLKESENENLICIIHCLYYFNFDIFVYGTNLEYILNRPYSNPNRTSTNYEQIYNLLNKKYRLSQYNDFQKFYKKFIKPVIINFAKAELISSKYLYKNNIDIMQIYNLRDELIMRMLHIKKSDLKRTTEIIYLKKFQDIFSDIVYQYRPNWLEKQSIDIYIPSKKIGIEIQGIQHYESVEFFGGKEQLLRQKELDKKKSILCKKNGIKLFYINSRDDNFDKIIDEIGNIN